METQLVYHRLGQWEPSFGIRPDKPSDFLLPHHDAEPTFPIHHDAVLTLIGCASEVRQIYGDGVGGTPPLPPTQPFPPPAWFFLVGCRQTKKRKRRGGGGGRGGGGPPRGGGGGGGGGGGPPPPPPR